MRSYSTHEYSWCSFVDYRYSTIDLVRLLRVEPNSFATKKWNSVD
jgi:hypothetical protein